VAMVGKCVVTLRVQWPGGAQNEALGGQVMSQVSDLIDWLFEALQKAGVYGNCPLKGGTCSDHEGGTAVREWRVRDFRLPEQEVER